MTTDDYIEIPRPLWGQISGTIGDQSDLIALVNVSTLSVKTTDYTILLSDSGSTLVMNSTSQHTFTLPAVPTVGMRITIAKINTGKLIIQAPASTVIIDSSSAGTCFNDSINEVFATLTLECLSSTFWTSISGLGTWTTT